MGRMLRLGGLVAFMLALPGGPATAREMRIPFYGVWMIVSARPAPWTASGAASDPYRNRRLIGRKVIFLWDAIDAPPPLGCDRPDYRMVDVPPDGLFQGNLTEPVIQAQALGFRPGARITTLQTGCKGLIDFHFSGYGTAMFALDNTIYTLRRR